MNEEKSTKKWTRYVAIIFSVLFISMGLVEGNFWLVMCGLSILPSLVLKLQENFNYTNETKWIVFAILFIVGMSTTDTQAMPDNTATNNLNTAIAVSSDSITENTIKNDIVENTNVASINNTVENSTNTNVVENKVSNNNVVENTTVTKNSLVEDKEKEEVKNTVKNTSTENKTRSTKPTTTQTKQAPASTPNSVTVYITDTGKKYHRDGCQYLKKSKHAISIDSATAQGYGPCAKCY